jgi:hypothetical protein
MFRDNRVTDPDQTTRDDYTTADDVNACDLSRTVWREFMSRALE